MGHNDHMTLVRFFARSALAGIFVVRGARTLKDPDPVVPAAKPVTDRVVPKLKRFAPPAVAERIPENTRTLVRVNAALHLLGGLSLLTRYRRAGALVLAGSLVPTTMAGHAFWEEEDAQQRSAQQEHFLKNLGLAGGLLLAAVDTEGKPGLVWRVQHGAKRARQASRQSAKTARREIKTAKATARREAKAAAAKAHLG